MKIVLTGFAACYKTSVGKLLANRLGLRFFDVDREAERRAGMTVRDIFEQFGEEYFRRAEGDELTRLTDKTDCVVACGGGSALLAQYSALAESATAVVWLDASVQTVISRLDGARPLADGKTPEQIARLMTERKPFYARYANGIFNTDGLSSEQVADTVAQWLETNILQ